MNSSIVWISLLILSAVLLIAEMLSGTFYLLTAGIASLAAAFAAYSSDSNPVVTLGTAFFTLALGLPLMWRCGAYHRRHTPAMNLDAETGEVPIVEIDGALRAIYSGAPWMFRESNEYPLVPGDKVRVLGIENTVLVVRKP